MNKQSLCGPLNPSVGCPPLVNFMTDVLFWALIEGFIHMHAYTILFFSYL